MTQRRSSLSTNRGAVEGRRPPSFYTYSQNLMAEQEFASLPDNRVRATHIDREYMVFGFSFFRRRNGITFLPLLLPPGSMCETPPSPCETSRISVRVIMFIPPFFFPLMVGDMTFLFSSSSPPSNGGFDSHFSIGRAEATQTFLLITFFSGLMYGQGSPSFSSFPSDMKNNLVWYSFAV